jgi:predicted phosphodiesterase
VQSTRTQVTVDVDGLGPTLFCHGSPRSDEECVTAATPAERVEAFTADVSEACLVTAHTHMQYDRRVGERRLLNPGSVGLPYELEPGNAYWALLGPEVELRRTPYDLEAAIGRMWPAGMPKFDQIEELMRTPPPQAEIIEHVEQVVFSG